MALNQCPIEVQKYGILVPNEIKQFETLNTFKFIIKRRVLDESQRRICKVYLRQVEFIFT